MKCDGVVTTLSVVSPIGSGAGALSALQVIVAYDRQGTKNEVTNASDLPSAITVGQLFSYSSAVAKSAINNSVAKMTRSCWASDLQRGLCSMTVLSLSVLAVPECMTMIFTLMRRRLDTLPL